jgi:hypothetical protein
LLRIGGPVFAAQGAFVIFFTALRDRRSESNFQDSTSELFDACFGRFGNHIQPHDFRSIRDAWGVDS